jgi:energy-coupling factor transport system ATP-binding protein
VPDAALVCEGLSYRYPEARSAALSDISLRVEPGEFVVLCGRSASGKSTLLRAACGLVPHFYGGEVEGELSVAGMDVRGHGPAELAAAVGLVAQEPETQVVSTTVRSEIALPLELRGHPPPERARAVEEVALALGLDGLLERTTDTLSGGELQRVALAAALATRPALVLLDEPTSQLDPVAGDELISLLRRLNEDWGVAVLLSEHRLERCLPAADRIVAMAGGSIAFEGAPRPFLEWALGAEPALATPAARMFAAAQLPIPGSVREGRAILARRAGPDAGRAAQEPASSAAPSREPLALRARSLWVELGEGRQRTEALRGLELELGRGERVALMGRNGAGKSTLFRAAAGLLEPARGSIEAPAGAALLPQRPDDLLVRERVGDELTGEGGARALELLGLAGLEDADPRDLSGGERQRLALAIVLAGRIGPGGEPPGLVMLDEPTRGMDRARKAELIDLTGELAGRGAGVAVATHDVEFAATFAERVVLLGRGEVVADGSADEILSGGWYFSTEVARILDGAAVGVEDGVALLSEFGRRDPIEGRR